MKRQDFILKCSTYCLGSVAFSSLFTGCSSYYYAQHTVEGNKLVINKKEFVFQKSQDKKIRSFILIKPDSLDFPICLYRLGENDFVALYLKCTHQGCEVQPHGEYLVCPCHGSEFSNRGVVMASPAEQDLKQFPVLLDNETIIIQVQ